MYCFTSNPISARCKFDAPILNRGHTFTIVDTSKYNIAGYDCSNNVLTEFENESPEIPDNHGYLMSVQTGPSWTTSHVATGNYIALSFKKLDGTDFTSEEIANAYGTIFTVENS